MRRFKSWRFALRMAWQRARRGYSDEQCWSLNHALAELTVVGVGRMREWAHGHPAELTMEEWDDILAAIEEGFQAWLDCDGWLTNNGADRTKFDEGMRLFAHWFGALWD